MGQVPAVCSGAAGRPIRLSRPVAALSSRHGKPRRRVGADCWNPNSEPRADRAPDGCHVSRPAGRFPLVAGHHAGWIWRDARRISARCWASWRMGSAGCNPGRHSGRNLLADCRHGLGCTRYRARRAAVWRGRRHRHGDDGGTRRTSRPGAWRCGARAHRDLATGQPGAGTVGRRGSLSNSAHSVRSWCTPRRHWRWMMRWCWRCSRRSVP